MALCCVRLDVWAFERLGAKYLRHGSVRAVID
jgi:hypothetical protein